MIASATTGPPRLRVICVAAARPNFMKVKPIIDALERRSIETVLVHTGQHYDEMMSGVFFEELGIRTPDHHLGAGSGSHAEQTGRIMVAFERLLDDAAADLVLVVGDVNSTLACSIVAAKAGLRVGHVEAGLRSRDWTMPEEINRVVTDRVSDLLFCPSADAVDNLRREGYREDQIHLVGNVMIDTLLANVVRARQQARRSALMPAGAFGVVTLHRPANVDDPTALRSLVAALSALAEEIPLVFPAHPRTRAALQQLRPGRGLHVVEPLGYLDFLGLMDAATLVLTDSGGIQEETTVLGVPCLTLRDNTERPVTISEGTNRLVGRDPSKILGAARDVLANGVPRRCPALWDGRASERVVDAILATSDAQPRPTSPAAQLVR